MVVAGWYHDWLDWALAGNSAPPFQGHRLDEQNATALASAAPRPIATAAEIFRESALSYLDRALHHVDAEFDFPFGTTTVGSHLGCAAAEWHLHAWDFHHQHRPTDPAELFPAAGRCMASARATVPRMALAALIPVGARIAPWRSLLKQSGRRA